MEKGNVEMMVRETAMNPINGKLNLVQYKKEKEKALKHKAVCEQVAAFADTHKVMPFYAILSVGVGSGSFKQSEYNKGYKFFNEDKVNTCLSMAQTYNSMLGIKGKPSDVTWRVVNRFYNRVSHNVNDFAKAIQKAKNLDDKRGHFKEICAKLGIN